MFASICRNFWECGLVAIDDITVSLGDCQVTAGKPPQFTVTQHEIVWYCRGKGHRLISTVNPSVVTNGRVRRANSCNLLSPQPLKKNCVRIPSLYTKARRTAVARTYTTLYIQQGSTCFKYSARVCGQNKATTNILQNTAVMFCVLCSPSAVTELQHPEIYAS